MPQWVSDWIGILTNFFFVLVLDIQDIHARRLVHGAEHMMSGCHSWWNSRIMFVFFFPNAVCPLLISYLRYLTICIWLLHCRLQEAFRAFHPNMKFVSKFMPSLEIGKLAAGIKKEEEIKKDFEELKKKAEEMVSDGWWNSSWGFCVVVICCVLQFSAELKWNDVLCR